MPPETLRKDTWKQNRMSLIWGWKNNHTAIQPKLINNLKSYSSNYFGSLWIQTFQLDCYCKIFMQPSRLMLIQCIPFLKSNYFVACSFTDHSVYTCQSSTGFLESLFSNRQYGWSYGFPLLPISSCGRPFLCDGGLDWLRIRTWLIAGGCGLFYRNFLSGLNLLIKSAKNLLLVTLKNSS